MNATVGTLGIHDAGGALDFGATNSLEGALAKSKEAFAQWEIEAVSYTHLTLPTILLV